MEQMKSYDFIIDIIARGCSLDTNLVRAIITVESAWNLRAIRYEASFYERYLKNSAYPKEEHRLLASSLGLMQIMGVVAREQGFDGPLENLFIPEVNILYGCILLRKLSQRYQTLEEIIAAYNAGSATRTPDGCFVNQGYVDKILKAMELAVSSKE